jgi:hypothetical protein
VNTASIGSNEVNKPVGIKQAQYRPFLFFGITSGNIFMPFTAETNDTPVTDQQPSANACHIL